MKVPKYVYTEGAELEGIASLICGEACRGDPEGRVLECDSDCCNCIVGGHNVHHITVEDVAALLTGKYKGQ